MASDVTIRMRHSVCGDKEFEEELERHISIYHDVDTTTRSQYLASLERRIKILEEKVNRHAL